MKKERNGKKAQKRKEFFSRSTEKTESEAPPISFLFALQKKKEQFF